MKQFKKTKLVTTLSLSLSLSTVGISALVVSTSCGGNFKDEFCFDYDVGSNEQEQPSATNTYQYGYYGRPENYWFYGQCRLTFNIRGWPFSSEDCKVEINTNKTTIWPLIEQEIENGTIYIYKTDWGSFGAIYFYPYKSSWPNEFNDFFIYLIGSYKNYPKTIEGYFHFYELH